MRPDDAATTARPRVAPLLVFAVGNPSRGDDALGPTLAHALRSAAPMKSLYVPGESSPLIDPSIDRTPCRKSETM